MNALSTVLWYCNCLFLWVFMFYIVCRVLDILYNILHARIQSNGNALFCTCDDKRGCNCFFLWIAIECPAPTAPANTHVQYESMTQGSIASFSCNAGYQFREGGTLRTIECLDSANWSNQIAGCLCEYNTALLRGPAYLETASPNNHKNQWNNDVILDWNLLKPYIMHLKLMMFYK